MHPSPTFLRRTVLRPMATLAVAAAFAVPTAGAQQQETAGGDIPAEKLIAEQEPHKRLSSELIGNPVLNRDAVEIGTLESLLFDEESRVIGAVIASGGVMGFGSKRVGLAWEAFELEERATGQISVYVDLTEEQVARAPEFRDRATLRAERMMNGAAAQ